MSDRPLTVAELNAMFEAVDNAALAREEREIRTEPAATATERLCPMNGPDGEHFYKLSAFVEDGQRCVYCGQRKTAA